MASTTGAGSTQHGTLGGVDLDLKAREGVLDVMDLAERAEAITDPALRAKVQKQIVDLAGPPAAIRKEAARRGQAMPHGGFPIRNEDDLHKAIRAIGRAKDPAAARRHIIKRARALGLSNLIPDTWDLSESIDLARLTKDGRPSFKGKPGQKWRHGYIPVNTKAKVAKAKGSPIAMKRMNRLFGGAKTNKVSVTDKATGNTSTASTAGQLRGVKTSDVTSNQRVKNSQFEANKVGRFSARAKQLWDKIPESQKTVRNGKRYVIATYGGKQILTEWHGGAREVAMRNTTLQKTLTAGDAASMSSAELRKILKNPKSGKAAKQVAYQALKASLAKGIKAA